MDSILTTILKYKKQEVNERKKKNLQLSLMRKIKEVPGALSLTKALKAEGASGIIAEFKPKSPSSGVLNIKTKADEVTKGYVAAGASALSVLTDSHFFGSSFENFSLVRQNNECPILMKDFIIDEYQVFEARSMGADVILLIAAALRGEEIKRLATLAVSLNMECILEVHSADELDFLCPEISIVGVNNRNLSTFSTDLSKSADIIGKIPGEYIKISESGIRCPEDAFNLERAGFNGFLIGGHFMKNPDPAEECRKFIQGLNYLKEGKC